jgi:hypothetical protein
VLTFSADDQLFAAAPVLLVNVTLATAQQWGALK